MSLKITDIERLTVDAGFRERPGFHMSRELRNWSISEVCRVTTDAGIVGYGETIIHYTWGRVNQAAIDRVMGKNPADLLPLKWESILSGGMTTGARTLPIYTIGLIRVLYEMCDTPPSRTPIRTGGTLTVTAGCAAISSARTKRSVPCVSLRLSSS
jgi:hypothetical protein